MEAETKSGKIVIANGQIVLERTGLVGKLAGFYAGLLPIKANRDSVIDIGKIQKVEYNDGIILMVRPHLKIHYGKDLPRYVIFKKPGKDIMNRRGALGELGKVVDELNRQGVKTVKID